MPKEKFILVSLKEEESKKLAQIVSNDTARKILDFLADSEATASELSKKLHIPLPTIHYNLTALLKTKMIEADEYHYSSKGKEILHYKLANKYIIIAPKSTFGIKEKLKSIIPVGVLLAGVSWILHLSSQTPVARSAQILESAKDESAALVAADATMHIEPSIALWFFLGGALSAIFILLIQYIIYKVKK